jgi:predicted SprT family Zn-dependent metalloprotease
MSAVRMVAYGILELKHKGVSSLWLQELSEDERNRELEENRQRDELRKLVNDELACYGLLITRMVVPKGKAWRTKMNGHILYGQAKGSKGFLTREILHEGDYVECCRCAAAILDALDQSQIPDTANG